MLRAPRTAFAGVAMVLGYAACGPQHPPRLDESIPAPDAGTGFVSHDSGADPLCKTLDDGGSCGCLELSFLSDPPNLYFVLDRSGSMIDSNKWQTVRSVITRTLVKLGPRVKYGAAVFPKVGTSCEPGTEVLSVRAGDSPAGSVGSSIKSFVTATSMNAEGGTPTAGTLVALSPNLKKLSGRTFVILATDGGPNCNPTAVCDETQCIANIESADGCKPNVAPNCCVDTPGMYGRGNCLDSAATTGAVADLHSANIPTYVIGVPGSAPYASLLDELATAGGTARAAAPLYYRVDSSDESEFEEAIRAIAAKVTARCDLPLDPPPADPSRVNVFFDDVVLPADPDNGWVLDGSTVNLVGTACDRVMKGEVLNLRVIGGCPTVKPK